MASGLPLDSYYGEIMRKKGVSVAERMGGCGATSAK
jgi:hypothetical protein